MKIQLLALFTGAILGAGMTLALPRSGPTNLASELGAMPCPDIAEVPASDSLRTLELPQFGVAIAIPENFRTRTLPDGTVEILDPGTFEVLRCVQQGGRAIAPRGMYSFRIRSLPNPANLALPDFLRQQGEADPSAQSGNLDAMPVLITRPEPGYTVRGWFKSPDSQTVIVLAESCDCELEYDDMRLWLQRTRLLP
ncbi:hypothetical protein P7L53_06850 [Thermoleptolyngbya sichuanensis XZ-Cy5]|uniref:hypothetical protein n=1 Tax=Thermoleptolyngbya sichuanensis TaxID=2885951 RepID=UPI00240D82B8|nr:hypothetical protein [Thermoleptolyngbya sichuanensis]MDG2615961.1 hypothetical protein [Thermoleptolyngbya sichuanensis XZ-Cy5]